MQEHKHMTVPHAGSRWGKGEFTPTWAGLYRRLEGVMGGWNRGGEGGVGSEQAERRIGPGIDLTPHPNPHPIGVI